MAAATGASSSPTSRSLSSARLTAASSSGMVVGPASLAARAWRRSSAGAGFSMKLLTDAVNRCHELIEAFVVAASGSRRAMREATSLDQWPEMRPTGARTRPGLASRRLRGTSSRSRPAARSTGSAVTRRRRRTSRPR